MARVFGGQELVCEDCSSIERELAAREARGVRTGKTEGRALGKAEGKTETLAAAVLRVLERRGLAVTDDDRARVSRCDDVATLEALAKGMLLKVQGPFGPGSQWEHLKRRRTWIPGRGILIQAGPKHLGNLEQLFGLQDAKPKTTPMTTIVGSL